MRLAELFCDDKNSFLVQTNIENSWYYVTIAACFMNMEYGQDLFKPTFYLNNILSIVESDREYTNTKKLIQEVEGFKRDKVDVLELLFEFKVLDDKEMQQVKFD